MLTELDVSNAVVVLCGNASRTARVAEKYADAAQLLHCSKPASLAVAERLSLAVICASESSEIKKWKEALTQLPLPVLLTVDSEVPPESTGTVFLIGAGPSDPQLLTLGALSALSAADVVLLDHLAPQEQVKHWAPRAEIVDVGKLPGQHAMPQRQIDELMISYAQQGKNVARLKGGDPYVFGRGAEEVFVCKQAGVPVEVISGVTSAIAVPALAGVPMTLRRVARMFTVVSGHAPLSEADLDALAGILQNGGTISLLMGVKTLPLTLEGLLERGVRKDLPVVAIENGFREGQRITLSDLSHGAFDLDSIVSPAITVFGDAAGVVGQHREQVMAEAFKTH
ncbi:MAG: uroporphyrinogen-III C-methyltransferase [Rothia sp. (in: high G+C Gram-positive bacteria)]|nr:uroporphyrinogen-III C-methyltransferase [Rothia sp. (in: high G+C Gram-positive bacteria)]